MDGSQPAANSVLASIQRRRGAHRAPAPRAAAPLPPSLREVARRSRDGRSPRAAARVSIWFAAKSKCQHGGLRAARPTQKGIDVAPKPKFCVGRDANSAAVGDEGALRMRHTLCGCIAPRISYRPPFHAVGALIERPSPPQRSFELCCQAHHTACFCGITYYFIPRPWRGGGSSGSGRRGGG